MRITASSDAARMARRFDLAPNRINTAVRVATTSVGVLVQREMTGVQGLRMFPRHPRGTATPSPRSAPYGLNPPAQVTTKLRTTTMRSAAIPRGFAKYEVQVYPTMVYARAQELGRREINLPARPFAGPTRQRVIRSGAALRLYQDQMRRRLMR